MNDPVRIVFHGANAASFTGEFASMLDVPATLAVLPDALDTAADRNTFAAAQVIVGTSFDATMPRPDRLLLYHLPAAGHDGIDQSALPPGAVLCNCFGHEGAIAEYVMAALLRRTVPLEDADRQLRQGAWPYWAGAPERAHPELAGSTIGLLGFGHIGRAVAARARAFGMRVHVANRSPVAVGSTVDRYYAWNELDAFWGSADVVIVTVPLVPDTRGLVGASALAAMRPDALLVNVARGPVVDEQALFEALRDRRIGGAAIDTWYVYPPPDGTPTLPSALPFHTLSNVLMTPHMSGWTMGTIRRRQEAMARNIGRRLRGQACENVVGS